MPQDGKYSFPDRVCGDMRNPLGVGLGPSYDQVLLGAYESVSLLLSCLLAF